MQELIYTQFRGERLCYKKQAAYRHSEKELSRKR